MDVVAVAHYDSFDNLISHDLENLPITSDSFNKSSTSTTTVLTFVALFDCHYHQMTNNERWMGVGVHPRICFCNPTRVRIHYAIFFLIRIYCNSLSKEEGDCREFRSLFLICKFVCQRLFKGGSHWSNAAHDNTHFRSKIHQQTHFKLLKWTPQITNRQIIVKCLSERFFHLYCYTYVREKAHWNIPPK